jgi:hypothetical protein
LTELPSRLYPPSTDNPKAGKLRHFPSFEDHGVDTEGKYGTDRTLTLNAALGLDKHEAQRVAEPEGENVAPASFAAKVVAESRATEMAP